MHHSLGILATWNVILLKNWIIILHQFLRSKQHKKASHFLHLKKCQEASACCIQEVRRKSDPYKKFTICMSYKAMGKISFIQTTSTRDVNGRCKLWSPKLCWGVFFCWRHQVKMYLIQSIHDYIQNTHNYSYSQATSKEHLWVWLTNQGEGRPRKETQTWNFPPFSQVNNAKDY